MAKTVYYTAASLDGFIADAGHGLDWLLQFGDPEGGDYEDFIASVGALAMGAHTYEWVLANAVRPPDGEAQPWPYAQPCWVFSTRSLPDLPDADLRFVRGDVRPVHRDMLDAAAGKDLWVVGGGELAGQFLDAGLLDALIVTIAPVTLGAGAPLLPRRVATPPLELVSARAWGDVFVRLHYRVARPMG